MAYPQHILPHQNYKFINIDDIPNEAMFLRILDNCTEPTNAEEIVKHTHQYTPSEKMLEGLSVSLLSVYTQKDCKFKIPKEHEQYHDNWKEGTEGRIPNDDQYKYDEEVPFIGMINQKIRQYELELNDLEQSSFFENTPQEILSRLNLSIEHSPTFCNFWHFNIFILATSNLDRKLYLADCTEIIDAYNSKHKKHEISMKALVHRITKKNPEYASMFVMSRDTRLTQLDSSIYIQQ